MADLVNLRGERKRRQRAEKESAAADNRARHGRPKAQIEAEEQRRALAAKQLDAHRREPSEGGRDE
jgi:hypothetical protein